MASTRAIEVDVHANVGVSIVRPGDKLVIATAGTLSDADIAEMRTGVAERLPGVEVIVIEDATMAVYRPDGQATDGT